MSDEADLGIVVLMPQTPGVPAHNMVSKRCNGWHETVAALREVTKNEPHWQAITICRGPDLDKILQGADYEGSVPSIPDRR